MDRAVAALLVLSLCLMREGTRSATAAVSSFFVGRSAFQKVRLDLEEYLSAYKELPFC